MKNTFAFIQKSEIRYEFTEASDTEIHKISCKIYLNKECRKLIKCLFPPAFTANYAIGFDPDAYIHCFTTPCCEILAKNINNHKTSHYAVFIFYISCYF